MGSVLHGSARTTPRVRAELQAAQASTRTLAAEYGLNPKTVAKWRRRTTTADAPMGPRVRRSTVLTPLEEAVVVEFRRRTLLPLDDVLGRLRETIPRLSRSALHRCLQRHDISRRPQDPDCASKRGRFAETAIGYVHIDACELRSAEGKVHLFLAIDRVSKFTYVELHPRATMLTGATFLRGVIAAFPYALHTVLTDNGRAFADLPRHRNGPTARYRGHAFDRVCWTHRIAHKLTRPYHPWTNGQAERMIRTVKEATVKVFHYETLESLAAHVQAFLTAYNFAKHLKGLRWRTPFQAICDAWARDPTPFKLNPHHLIPGPYIYLTVLALASMPALGNFAGGLLADLVRVSPRVLSFALHAAAGIVFAVVGVELMPQALEAESVWLIVLLFAAGGAFAVLVDWAMGAVRLRSRTGTAEAGTEAGPWAIYFGVAVDLFSDGVMIGAGSTISPGLGLLLALGQVPADIPEGFATIATFKAQGVRRRRRLLLAASFALPILLGATISYFALRGQAEVYKLGLLAFTAGILLTVAVEEIVVEAHREEEGRTASLFLVGGFALFVALGELLEARGGDRGAARGRKPPPCGTARGTAPPSGPHSRWGNGAPAGRRFQRTREPMGPDVPAVAVVAPAPPPARRPPLPPRPDPDRVSQR